MFIRVLLNSMNLFLLALSGYNMVLRNGSTQKLLKAQARNVTCRVESLCHILKCRKPRWRCLFSSAHRGTADRTNLAAVYLPVVLTVL